MSSLKSRTSEALVRDLRQASRHELIKAPALRRRLGRGFTHEKSIVAMHAL
jgi:hypothetical protein